MRQSLNVRNEKSCLASLSTELASVAFREVIRQHAEQLTLPARRLESRQANDSVATLRKHGAPYVTITSTNTKTARQPNHPKYLTLKNGL